MNIEEVKKRIRTEILDPQFPELANIEPIVGELKPAESQLRKLRRTRAVITTIDLQSIPQECPFIYQLRHKDGHPFDMTLVVTTDEEGKPQFIIESK